jgi:acyl-CoA synthetase (AMP-forming)/AMP-acid ligase II
MSPDDHNQGIGPADVLGSAQLLRQGELAADALTRLGVGQGDPVAVLLPMCLESVVVTLASIRLGAMRITLPVGNHLGFVRNRIRSSGAGVVVCADSCRQDDEIHDVKAGLDRALWGCPAVHTVLVVPQLARPIPWVPGRDLWWHETLTAQSTPAPAGPYAGPMSTTPSSPPDRVTALDFGDPLDQRSPDDADEGWGERLPESPDGGGGGAADIARFLSERPPHHF